MKDREIEESIQKLAGTYLRDIVSVQLCSVDSVDKGNRVCDCTPIGGNAETTIPKVRLMAENNDGFLVLPKVDSTVLIALSTRGYAYVVMYSDIDEVLIVIGEAGNYTSYNIKDGLQQFNDGTFGGLIKIINLTTELNDRYTILKNAMLAGFTATDSAITSLGGTPGSVTAYNAAIASFTNLVKTQYENLLITHGE